MSYIEVKWDVDPPKVDYMKVLKNSLKFVEGYKEGQLIIFEDALKNYDLFLIGTEENIQGYKLFRKIYDLIFYGCYKYTRESLQKLKQELIKIVEEFSDEEYVVEIPLLEKSDEYIKQRALNRACFDPASPDIIIQKKEDKS